MFQLYISIRSLLNANDPEGFKPSTVDWTLAYLSLSVGVTLLCTLLIVFRIVTVGRANRDAALGGYRLIIEIIVESAALLSIIVIIYMVTYVRGVYPEIYIDVIAASIKVRLILFYAVSFSLLCRESPRLLLLVASLLDMHVLMMLGREVYSLPFILELATTLKHKPVTRTVTSATRHLVLKMAPQMAHWRNLSLRRKEYDFGCKHGHDLSSFCHRKKIYNATLRLHVARQVHFLQISCSL